MAQMFIQQNPSSYNRLAGAMTQPQQQQQQPQMPNIPFSAISQFTGGGSGGGMFGGGGLSGMFGGGGASGAASGGASSGGGALASAGPWAALAAAIIGNEWAARDAGRRDEDGWGHAQDLITGKVLEQDMDYYGDKVGGVGGEIIQLGGRLGHPEGVFDTIKDLF